MVVSKQVSTIHCLAVMLQNIGKSILDKFTKFYTKRIHDTDLAPSKTFSYDFMLGNPSSTAHKRSLEKLKALFVKHLTKNIPALQMTTTEFMPINRSNGYLTVNLFNLYVNEVIPAVNKKLLRAYKDEGFVFNKKLINSNSTERMIYFKCVEELRSLYRYVKYLNYLARKYEVPVVLEVDLNTSSDTEKLDSNSKTLVSIKVSFAGWILRTTRNYTRYKAIKETGAVDDALFSDAELWNTVSLSVNGEGNSMYRCHISKLFLHMDKVLKVFNSLSRKVEYGYSAFDFRTQ